LQEPVDVPDPEREVVERAVEILVNERPDDAGPPSGT